MNKPLTVEEIKELTGDDGRFATAVRLTLEELIWEDPAGIDNLVSERICGDEGLLCSIQFESFGLTGGEGKSMFVELNVTADPRLLLR